MNLGLIKATVLGTALALTTLTSCEKNDGPDNEIQASGPDDKARKYITLTGAFPDSEGEAGNGGTKAYSITLDQAADPNFEVKLFADGYGLRSQRTARVQGSVNGNFLYNIQYTGNDGGIFNKYAVEGTNKFTDTREEVNTAPILGTSPRWVIAAEGIGIGVHATAKITGSSAGADADFVSVKSTAKIAVLDLNDPVVKYVKQEFEIPFTPQQLKDGYQIGRIDVPILNKAKNKVFIGCNLSRTDVTKPSTMRNDVQSWSTAPNLLGTATLVLDYPTLENPTLIYSANSKVNNHSYRTMTQYVGTDGHIYQATAVSGSQILRINSSTNKYDDAYNFDLKSALAASNGIAIRAWRYVKDGVGLVLYTQTGVDGGFIALVDLNAKTATKLTTDNEGDIGLSGRSANTTTGVTAITGTFGQFQNIGVSGDNLYVPMTPNGVDGNLYIINYKNKSITKGAKLKNQSGSFYIGAY